MNYANLTLQAKRIDYTKYINYIIIAYAFVLPTSRAALSILGFSMILLWIMQGNFKEKYELLKKNKVVVYLFLLILLGYLSLFWTGVEHLKDGASVATKTLRILFLPMIVIATTLKKENLNKVLTAFLLGMLISEVLSYGIFFELWTLRHGTPDNPTPFMYHIDYSVFLAFTALLLLSMFFNTQNKKLKIFYISYFLFVVSNLFINTGRTGQLAFAVAIFTVALLNIKKKILAIIASILLLVSIFYLAYSVSSIFKTRVDVAVGEIIKLNSDNPHRYYGSAGQRVGLWILGIEIFYENPILGVGAGSISSTLDTKIEQSSPEFHGIVVRSMHNTYMHYLVMLGLLGLILYLMIWYNMFKMKIKDKHMSNLKIIFITVMCTASLVEILFHNQFPLSLFALFVGIFIMLNISETTTEVSSQKIKRTGI